MSKAVIYGLRMLREDAPFMDFEFNIWALALSKRNGKSKLRKEILLNRLKLRCS